MQELDKVDLTELWHERQGLSGVAKPITMHTSQMGRPGMLGLKGGGSRTCRVVTHGVQHILANFRKE